MLLNSSCKHLIKDLEQVWTTDPHCNPLVELVKSDRARPHREAVG
jgi:hypothetical protein